MDAGEMLRTLEGVIQELRQQSSRDSEQEVLQPALRILDVVIAEAKKLLPDHPVVREFEELVSVQAIERGEAQRAADLAVALVPLAEAIRTIVPKPRARATAISPDSPPIRRKRF